MTPPALVSALMAPVAGRVSDRLGGKSVLLARLILFVLGLGCAFAPLFSIAMRAVKTGFAGAASGVLNTMLEFGALVGAVTVGALLQSRLGVEFAPSAAFPVLFVEAMRPSLLVPYRCSGRCRGRLLGDAARLAAFAYRDARLAARA